MSDLIERLADMADFFGDESQDYFVAQSVAKEHAADLREALSRLQSLSDQNRLTGGWRDIASAPTDGSEILLYGRCEYDGRIYAPDSNVGWWDAVEGVWMTRRDLIEATHWQPLPSPPLPLPGGEEKR